MSVRPYCLLLVCLGCGGNTQALAIPTDEKHTASVEEIVSRAGTNDPQQWLRKQIVDGSSVYWIENRNCLEWVPTIVQESPLIVGFRSQQRVSGARDSVYVHRLVVDFTRFAKPRYFKETLKWSRVHSKTPWEAEGKTISVTYNGQLRTVNHSDAISFVHRWWWFGTYQACSEDLQLPLPHSKLKIDRFEEDEGPWPTFS